MKRPVGDLGDALSGADGLCGPVEAVAQERAHCVLDVHARHLVDDIHADAHVSRGAALILREPVHTCAHACYIARPLRDFPVLTVLVPERAGEHVEEANPGGEEPGDELCAPAAERIRGDAFADALVDCGVDGERVHEVRNVRGLVLLVHALVPCFGEYFDLLFGIERSELPLLLLVEHCEPTAAPDEVVPCGVVRLDVHALVCPAQAVVELERVDPDGFSDAAVDINDFLVVALATPVHRFEEQALEVRVLVFVDVPEVILPADELAHDRFFRVVRDVRVVHDVHEHTKVIHIECVEVAELIKPARDGREQLQELLLRQGIGVGDLLFDPAVKREAFGASFAVIDPVDDIEHVEVGLRGITAELRKLLCGIRFCLCLLHACRFEHSHGFRELLLVRAVGAPVDLRHEPADVLDAAVLVEPRFAEDL